MKQRQWAGTGDPDGIVRHLLRGLEQYLGRADGHHPRQGPARRGHGTFHCARCEHDGPAVAPPGAAAARQEDASAVGIVAGGLELPHAGFGQELRTRRAEPCDGFGADGIAGAAAAGRSPDDIVRLAFETADAVSDGELTARLRGTYGRAAMPDLAADDISKGELWSTGAQHHSIAN